MHLLQNFIDQNIPISHQMGIKLISFDSAGLVISAPLLPNINDKQTAFAGSLATVVTLSGWALTMLTIKNVDLIADVAITHSEIEYKKPVTENFQAICAMPKKDSITDFISTLQSRRRAHWTISSSIINDATNDIAVKFTGSYIAFLKT